MCGNLSHFRCLACWVVEFNYKCPVVHDYCRLCTISFKVKFGSNLGKQSHSSSENLFWPSNERIALGLCQPKFVKKLDCRFFISCNILIGSVTHVAGKFVTWASFTSSLKLQIHPRQLPWLRTANILLTRRTKPAQHGKNQNPPVSIRGQQSHPRSKVPPRLLKQIKKVSLLFFFGEN